MWKRAVRLGARFAFASSVPMASTGHGLPRAFSPEHCTSATGPRKEPWTKLELVTFEPKAEFSGTYRTAADLRRFVFDVRGMPSKPGSKSKRVEEVATFFGDDANFCRYSLDLYAGVVVLNADTDEAILILKRVGLPDLGPGARYLIIRVNVLE